MVSSFRRPPPRDAAAAAVKTIRLAAFWIATTLALFCMIDRAESFSSISQHRTMLVGSRVSGFGGHLVLVGVSDGPPSSPARQRQRRQRSTSTSTRRMIATMKKGKANVPPNMRGQLKRQQEMQAQREQMIAATKPGADGLPVFNLFVRTKRANMWYPCGSFKGDEKSKALCDTIINKGFLSGLAKKQLDSGMEGSLYRDVDKLTESVFRAYPSLRSSARQERVSGGKDYTGLQYGYRVAYEGFDDKQPCTEITPKEVKGVFDGLKNLIS